MSEDSLIWDDKNFSEDSFSNGYARGRADGIQEAIEAVKAEAWEWENDGETPRSRVQVALLALQFTVAKLRRLGRSTKKAKP